MEEAQFDYYGTQTMPSCPQERMGCALITRSGVVDLLRNFAREILLLVGC